MFTVTKRIEISAAHFLTLPYESKCSNIHGHNWIVDVEISSTELDDYGMVIDFTIIKKIVKEKLDHKNLNEILNPINPTAENIAKWIADELYKPCCKKNMQAFVSKVTVQESEGNTACYIP